MPFIIETFDKPGTLDLRKKLRGEHLVYLDEIKHLLLACGAKLKDDDTDLGGGLYLVNVDTREAAQALIEADPFHRANLFERVQITRWRKAYLDGQCFL